MGSLDQRLDGPIKLLFLGDSGTGKTGALWSLVKAGYKLRIADFDNGVDILINLARKENIALLSNIDAISFTDTFRSTPAGVIPAAAKAWPAMTAALNKWEGLGAVESWGLDTILVIDSVNFAGKAATRYALQLNGKLAKPPEWSDYRAGQLLMENLFAMLYSDSIKCHIIGLTHIREIGKTEDVVDDKGKVRTYTDPSTVKGFPETGIGKALSPTIGRYFNSVLLADIVGTGVHTKRVIRTQPHGNIGLKNAAPGLVKAEYPLESGLADFFKILRGTAQAAPQAT